MAYLAQVNKKMEQELMEAFEQLDLKSNELVQAKNAIMELTEENRSLSK